jgi:hypothetical protein
MPQQGRFVPNNRNRQKHVLVGLVVDHVDHSTGRWLWKKTWPALKVAFPSKDYQRLIQIVECINHLAPTPTDHVEIGFKSITERDKLPIGTVVEVTLSTSNQIDSFFTGAELFRWEGVEKAYAKQVAS